MEVDVSSQVSEGTAAGIAALDALTSCKGDVEKGGVLPPLVAVMADATPNTNPTNFIGATLQSYPYSIFLEKEVMFGGSKPNTPSITITNYNLPKLASLVPPPELCCQQIPLFPLFHRSDNPVPTVLPALSTQPILRPIFPPLRRPQSRRYCAIEVRQRKERRTAGAKRQQMQHEG